MIISIIIISIVLLITVLYLLSAIVHINKINKELASISEEQSTQNKDIIKLGLYQLEQHKLNDLVIKKFQEIDEFNLIKYVDQLKSTNKIGEA